MAPTRELAKQVADTFVDIAPKGITVLCVYGGTPMGPQGITYLPSSWVISG